MSIRVNSLTDAIELSRIVIDNSDVKKARVVAIMTQNGRVRSVGVNRLLVCQDDNEFTVHAEDRATRRPPRRIKGANLWIVRLLRDGTPALAKPCAHCQMLIARRGIPLSRCRWTVNEI